MISFGLVFSLSHLGRQVNISLYQLDNPEGAHVKHSVGVESKGGEKTSDTLSELKHNIKIKESCSK